jgi:transcriptional regulator GlxA family with amidase domain
MPPLNTAILLFPDVEVLDFAGPFEVFSVTDRTRTPKPFNVYTIARELHPVLARNNLSINPHYSLNDCPRPDLLILPGGFGTRPLLNDERIINWIRHTATNAQLTLSVCTGALLLAKAGLLDHLPATTHHGAFDLLAQTAPTATVIRDRRYIDTGRIITSAGISAGLDASLHLVSRLLSPQIALETATYMEYRWHPDNP